MFKQNLSKIAKWSKSHLVLISAISLLLVVEVIVRVPGFWTLDQSSSTGIINPIVKASLQNSQNPDVVFLGSSRFRNGISPVVIAESLDVPESSIVNISFAGGTPMDYIDVYRENRNVMKEANLLVINVGARDFNWGRPSALGNRFRQDSSLIERIQVPDLQKRADLTAGWLWKTWDARSMLRGYGTKILKQKSPTPSFPEANIRVDDLKRVNPLSENDAVPMQMQSLRYPHDVEFKNFHISLVHLQALAELVEMAHRDGLEVVLMETPLSHLTSEEIATNFSREDTAWRNQVQLSTGLRVELIPLDNTHCGITSHCFLDYGHMSSEGAVQYSEALATWLELEYTNLLHGDSLAVQK